MTGGPAAEPAPALVRTAYLVTEYPALSHTFIEKEVSDLRALGVVVHTFSVRPSSLPQHVETTTTPQLLADRSALVRACARLVSRHPRAAATAVRRAIATGVRRRSPRAVVWQVFYLVEAVLLHRLMEAAGVRHVHAHFANNAADVARLVATVGSAVDGRPGSWSWSMSVHGPTDFDEAQTNDLTAKAHSAAFAACISDYSRGQLMRHTDPAHWERFAVVRMTTHDSVLHTDPAPPDGGPLRLLFVGRLVPQKAPHVLIDALAGLAPHGPPVELVVIGDGPEREALVARSAGLPSNVRVRFLGGQPHDAVLPWYRWAHVFVLPSFSEGLPVVLMEAMGSALAVVTTPIAGIPELVQDGRSGVLVAPGRVDLLTAALVRLGDDPELRAALGARAREAVRSCYTGTGQAEVLRRLLAATPSAHRPLPEPRSTP